MAHIWAGLLAVASMGIGTQDTFDISGHKASFVTVEPGVQLEVLDWGGTGPDLVMLAGLAQVVREVRKFLLNN